MKQTMDENTNQLRSLIKKAGETDSGEEGFQAPWQARVFAIAVTLCESGHISKKQFESKFIENIQSREKELNEDTEEGYYGIWTDTLLEVINENNNIEQEDLKKRINEFKQGDKDLSEFTIQERSSHLDEI